MERNERPPRPGTEEDAQTSMFIPKAPRPPRRPGDKAGTRKKPNRDLEASVMRECRGILAGHPNVALFERRTVGTVQNGDRQFTVGVKGRADYWAALTDGTHVEIEVKRRDGKGRLSPDQKEFQRVCAQMGIPHAVVINGDELKIFLASTLAR